MIATAINTVVGAGVLYVSITNIIWNLRQRKGA